MENSKKKEPGRSDLKKIIIIMKNNMKVIDIFEPRLAKNIYPRTGSRENRRSIRSRLKIPAAPMLHGMCNARSRAAAAAAAVHVFKTSKYNWIVINDTPPAPSPPPARLTDNRSAVRTLIARPPPPLPIQH